MTDQKMKRRYIYMDDETWEVVRRRAVLQGQTMSEYVRETIEVTPPGEPRHDTPTSHLHLPEEK